MEHKLAHRQHFSSPESRRRTKTPKNVIERRRSPRWVPDRYTQVACHANPTGLGPDVTVCVLDISAGGVRLVVDQPLAPSQEVEVYLYSPALPQPIRRPATVAWVEPVPETDGLQWVGLAFGRNLPAQELRRLV